MSSKIDSKFLPDGSVQIVAEFWPDIADQTEAFIQRFKRINEGFPAIDIKIDEAKATATVHIALTPGEDEGFKLDQIDPEDLQRESEQTPGSSVPGQAHD